MAEVNAAADGVEPLLSTEKSASLELQREQKYVDLLYSRLAELRQEAQQGLASTLRASGEGTPQNRSERDSFAVHYEERLSQLNSVDDRLVFGRLDMQDDSSIYVGKIGLSAPDLSALLVDWRAPASARFYQATGVEPQGVRVRRHLLTKGTTVVSIEDEVLDREYLESQQASGLQGEGALIAALNARRTGRMSDIVSTIQAEQDAIIRSEARGVLVVQGGPGTGKTAVALHRAAYLLYSHRERLKSSGVLLLGPSRNFLRYIERVLPSLGETGVVSTTMNELLPDVSAIADDDEFVARLKGDVRMVDLLRTALSFRQRQLSEPVEFDINGSVVRLHPKTVSRARSRARGSKKPHNKARDLFVKAILNELANQVATDERVHGRTVDEQDVLRIKEDIRSSREVRIALNRLWMPLTPERFLEDLFADQERIKQAAPSLSDRAAVALVRPKGSEWTVSDVPLLDEAAELLGELPAASRGDQARKEALYRHEMEHAKNAIRNMGVAGLVDAKDLVERFAERTSRGTLAEQAAADREWVYGHVIVDEAQELSPMMWRSLVRRCPSLSFTIVGDMAQAASAASASSWQEALAPVLKADFQISELSVNYRTPRQISAVATAVVGALGLRVAAPTAVREGEWPVSAAVIEPDGLADQVVAAVDQARQRFPQGSVAVIVPALWREVVAQRVVAVYGDAAGVGAADLRLQVNVLSSMEAKGLEFDSVVVVGPQTIAQADRHGINNLYVALTRPTQLLTVLVEDQRLKQFIDSVR